MLKVAFMKYGRNQWSRIASLLPRKTAKQCKARWNEWLDPSIKKVEWTREEEEKLLHLAKLMPTQWRTIAPIVGRTAAQCLEHYEKLLAQALKKDGDGDEEDDDPRRLRQGEIDPNPEAKPARPDAVDMDEDEKEMLSEARARMANTSGKKEKRKARERQMAEAKRLDKLQKARELKAAGIKPRRKKNHNKGGVFFEEDEIPFERKPPPGFFEVPSAEEERRAATFNKQVVKRKSADELAEERREEDERRQKRARKEDLPAAIKRSAEAADPVNVRKRSKLSMPAPQMTDAELAELVRLGHVEAELRREGEQASGVTKSLLNTYVAPTPTPMRTPMSGPTGNHILDEAARQAQLQSMQTPLAGGVGEMLAPGAASSRASLPQTPNALALAARASAAGGVGMTTPMLGGASVSTTPGIRDGMGINKLTGERDVELGASLAALPAPRNEFAIAAPAADADEADEAAMFPEEASLDADEVARRVAERKEAKRAAVLAMRTAAAQRGLPRPPAVLASEPLVDAEAERLLRLDAAIASAGRPTRDHVVLEDAALAGARRLIDDELVVVGRARRTSPSAFDAVHARIVAELDVGEDAIAAHKRLLDDVRAHMRTESDACQKLTKKLAVLTRGLEKRGSALAEQLAEAGQRASTRVQERNCYERLDERESEAAARRVERLEADVDRARSLHVSMQKEWKTGAR